MTRKQQYGPLWYIVWQCLALSLTLGLSLPACAQGAAPEVPVAPDLEVDAQVDQIFGQLMSPFCPGKLLRDCSSSRAAELRIEVHNRLTSGVSPEQVIGELLTRYGEEMRAAPRAKGFGLYAWIVPPAFLGVGLMLFVLWWSARGRKEQASDRIPQIESIDSKMSEKINRLVKGE
jgi:cytochrome c-type biogenesis protein CcmH/NrfF